MATEGGWMKQVTGITYCDEHSVMYRIIESQNCAPKTNVTLSVDYIRITILKITTF